LFNHKHIDLITLKTQTNSSLTYSYISAITSDNHLHNHANQTHKDWGERQSDYLDAVPCGEEALELPLPNSRTPAVAGGCMAYICKLSYHS
jgi:hypothetical protein